MSVKRQATTELNHENWDQDDPSEHEDMGTFKPASKDVLEKRVIRTAKRRVTQSDETKKSVFSRFGGFNKPPPSSFDFLANLTNGNKTNGSSTGKNETAVSSNLFGNKTPSGGLFTMPVSSSPVTKPTFGIATSPAPSVFGGATKSPTQSPFMASKADSTVTETAFKIQPIASLSPNLAELTPKTTVTNSPSPAKSNMFASTNNKSLFSTTANNTNSFKSQPTSGASATQNFGATPKSQQSNSEKKVDTKDDKKMTYYAKLKGLNESVSDWIRKHVEETPLCILSPIFKDYENHLTKIQDEYHGTSNDTSIGPTEETPTEPKTSPNSSKNTNNSSGLFPKTSFENQNTSAQKTSGFSFGINTSTSNATNNQAGPIEKPSIFSFGVNAQTSSSPTKSATTSTTTTTAGGFSFGITTQTTTASSSPFSLNTNSNINPNGTAPFSFGIGNGKPFSFNLSAQKPVENTSEKQDKEEEDEPPKVEFTPVVEENSVFDKRCKIFVKKDGNYVDKGVGTLYVKKIEETGKHQLLVRANTNLGNILLNLILTSSIPTQRLGKNNVMLVCIPTPEAKPPPTPILIRVKTPEEADGLLETLNKFKE